MSYYSLVCIEILKEIWPRVHSYLKRRDLDVRHPDRAISGKDTILLVFEWNHSPNAYDIKEYMYKALGLDYGDFNVTVVGENNGYEDPMGKGMYKDKSIGGLLDISYKCTDDDGHWAALDDPEGKWKSTIVFEGEEMYISYRLTDEEYERMLDRHYTEDCE